MCVVLFGVLQHQRFNPGPFFGALSHIVKNRDCERSDLPFVIFESHWRIIYNDRHVFEKQFRVLSIENEVYKILTSILISELTKNQIFCLLRV